MVMGPRLPSGDSLAYLFGEDIGMHLDNEMLAALLFVSVFTSALLLWEYFT
jgi:hypothetical protein